MQYKLEIYVLGPKYDIFLSPKVDSEEYQKAQLTILIKMI